MTRGRRREGGGEQRQRCHDEEDCAVVQFLQCYSSTTVLYSDTVTEVYTVL